ncbi:MAG: T9SS type A sorting domain-containing protein [Bacteroidetes bacterium]|uniref:T9SS type A sorting domain-containing protein n=1 Tax=Candidatus Gallipaludibacter merdavium TaxID=2840839 RepID=A0A9D9HVX5_9BACT|nr:T9SS type A sorting domain-containing protein [Candidatus Gallipaludibacter merdavium]
MKKITLLAVSLLMAITAMAADITGGTKLYLKPNSNWMDAGARFAAYFFVDDQTYAWAGCTLAANETNIYEVTAPEGTWANVIFCRMNPSTTENNWGNKWDQSVNQTYDGFNNLFTVNDGQWNNASGTWSQYVIGQPSVEFGVSTILVVNEAVTLSATAANVADPVYVYSVKQGAGEYTVLSGNTWTPVAAGEYTIKVEVKNGAAAEVLVSKEATTTVVVKPEEITIKVQVPAEGLSSWTAEGGVYFYAWGNGMEGTFTPATAEEDNWYSYTISTETVFPLNFIVLNGSSWDALANDARRQTVNMENIVESACYVMANGGETEGQNNWNKVLNPTDCPSESGEATAIEETSNAPLFTVNGRTLNVAMDNEAEISIYTISGQMIEHTVASNLTREMQQGVYVVRIGNQSQKLVIF